MTPHRTIAPAAANADPWLASLGFVPWIGTAAAFLFGMLTKIHFALAITLFVLQILDCWVGAEGSRRTGDYEARKDEFGFGRKIFRDTQVIAAWALDLAAIHSGLWLHAVATGACMAWLIGKEIDSLRKNWALAKEPVWRGFEEAQRKMDDAGHLHVHGTPAPARRHYDAALEELRDGAPDESRLPAE